MLHNLRTHLPRIGMRIAKTALAAGVSILMYYMFGFDRLPFFIVMAAMECMKPYHQSLKSSVLENTSGLFIGAAWALLIILLQDALPMDPTMLSVWHALFIAVGIAGSLYTAVVFNCVHAASFAAVIFLVIVGVRVDNEDPFLYVTRRLAETLVGIGVGTAINAAHLPRRKRTDTLFAVSMDEVLHSEISHLSDYSKVEINRILDDGIPLTLMTRHSAAALRESGSGIQYKLPMILMDGAAIFDPTTDRYLKTVSFSHEEAVTLQRLLQSHELSVFVSSVVDNTMLLYYDEILLDAQFMFEQLRRSPYRNYIKRPFPEDLDAIAVAGYGEREKVRAVYETLMAQGYRDHYKVQFYEFGQCSAYMRIISKEAKRHDRLKELLAITGYEKSMSFGKDPENYDVCVKADEGESIVKALRRHAEPYFWQK